MLRQQSAAFDPMTFLSGDGEMAARIREFDWAGHPLGEPDVWPQSLRSALSICLTSAFPTAIYWGNELRLLYNDAWAPIPGPRHPAALGAPASEVWSDIWHIIEPQFSQVIRTGEGIFVENQRLPMRRYGVEEETYWNYGFSPLRGEAGDIVGILNAGSETTDNVIQRRSAEFIASLNEALRTCATARDALPMALERLGDLLSASRVGLRERVSRQGAADFPVSHEWSREGVPTYDQPLALQSMSAAAREALLSGRVLRFTDTDPALDAESRAFLQRAQVSSALAVPWMERGEVAALLYVHSHTAREFTDLDVSAIERVLALTMGWIERERHRERERIMTQEIDHRARNMLAVVQAITRLTKADDAEALKSKLEDRFAALARSHGLLSRKRWTGITFEDLAREELAPYGPSILDRITLGGPEVPVSAGEAQLLEMILHELVTNAMKHGALSGEVGTISIAWALTDDGDMKLTWNEEGGPGALPRTAPASKSGFGSVMLTRVVEDLLGGRLTRLAGEGAVSYEILLPRDEVPGRSRVREDGSRDAAATLDASRSVMVVEDDAIVSMDLAATLEDAGYRLFGQFRSVASALDGLAAATPDIALVDVDLGGARSDPVRELLASRGVPYVIVSGHDAPDGPADGDVHQLAKPISHAQLLSLLKRI